LLKNSVPIPEYVLFSEDLYRGAEATIGERARLVNQELEGLGLTRAYFVGLGEADEAPSLRERAIWPKRLAATLGLMGRGMPYMLGLKRARAVAD
jgi:hypothetical protein